MKKTFFHKVVGLTSCIVLLTCCTPSFHQVRDYVDGIAVAQNDEGQYSYIDLKGRLINRKAVLKEAEDFENGHAKVQFFNGKYGFVDKSISVKPPKSFDDISSFYLGHAIYKKDGKYGYIDEQLNEIPLPKYSSIGSFGESGYAHVYNNGKCGLINSSYEEVIECKYDEIGYYGDDAFIASFGNKKGILSLNGKFVPLNEEYGSISAFSDGLARVSAKKAYSYQDTKYGFINKAGELVIPCRYNNVGDFKNGKATVNQNGVSYNIDKGGNIVEVVNMSLNGRWKHNDSYYGVYTFRINGSSFEYWYPDRMIDSGTLSRDGNTLTLKGRNTYTVQMDLENLALVYQGDKYYSESNYIIERML